MIASIEENDETQSKPINCFVFNNDQKVKL